ncbi:hypothetical protein Tco_0802308 [Tanacetum coccineum]|uniref:Reverse transcriptase domain-containing protein n=1 Tax=Tanacetum coccineum TaxID=301880 RepID=A0ABQ4ZYF8_9ASTR
MFEPSQPILLENNNNPRVLPYYTTMVRYSTYGIEKLPVKFSQPPHQVLGAAAGENRDKNPIHTLGDYSEGYRNTIDIPIGNNVVPPRSDTIRLMQNGYSFHGLRSKDPNQHLKDFLKLVDSLDLDGSREADACRQNNPVEHVYLSEGDIYDDPSLLRSKFEDELANFMLEKNSHTKGIGKMLDQYRKEMHEQFSQILSTIGKSETPKPEAQIFSITTRSRVSTRDPLFPTPSKPTLANNTKGATKKEGPKGSEEAEKDDEDERLLSIFKQIHINLPFLEAMIHMPKGAKVLKDLLSHKEKLEKATSLIKLSEECSAIIQRNLPQKEGDPGSFTLPFDFIVLEMDEVELVPIILRRPFLATTRAVIDVHEGKLSLRVGSKTVTFNIRKSMKSKHSQDDYLYCANHTAKLVQEQWVDTVDHDKKWTEVEVEEDSNKVQAVSFYPRIELENNQLPVVICSALFTVKKARLLEVLQNPKGAIAWSIANIKGIDSSFYTHKILMEDNFKPIVQPQRRVNPNIKEVIPKKGGMTIVKNEKNELIPQRTVIEWRVCIDYRNLNNATQKDHFPLSFIDQMLECLAWHEYYCFLDGFSEYFHIPIALEDQEKTTFTYPYETFA